VLTIEVITNRHTAGTINYGNPDWIRTNVSLISAINNPCNQTATEIMQKVPPYKRKCQPQYITIISSIPYSGKSIGA
jgi:hypothetical protein